MTSPETNPQAGIADAVGQLSEQTRLLVRSELSSAQMEMWEKGKQAAPAAVLLGLSGVLGVAAMASGYRLALRILERAMPAPLAALVALVASGSAAGWAAAAGARRLSSAALPFPTETIQATGKAVAAATDATDATEAADDPYSPPPVRP